jgi:hypothetical protein
MSTAADGRLVDGTRAVVMSDGGLCICLEREIGWHAEA